jgi:hypothetical protein
MTSIMRVWSYAFDSAMSRMDTIRRQKIPSFRPRYKPVWIFGLTRFLHMPLAEQTKRKFLWDNCAKLYGLEG